MLPPLTPPVPPTVAGCARLPDHTPIPSPQDYYPKILDMVTCSRDVGVHLAALQLLNALPVPPNIEPLLRRTVPNLLGFLQLDNHNIQVRCPPCPPGTPPPAPCPPSQPHPRCFCSCRSSGCWSRCPAWKSSCPTSSTARYGPRPRARWVLQGICILVSTLGLPPSLAAVSQHFLNQVRPEILSLLNNSQPEKLLSELLLLLEVLHEGCSQPRRPSKSPKSNSCSLYEVLFGENSDLADRLMVMFVHPDLTVQVQACKLVMKLQLHRLDGEVAAALSRHRAGSTALNHILPSVKSAS